MKYTRLLLLAIIPLMSVGLGLAYGQDGSEETPLHHYGLAGLSFIAAGVVYSSFGWIKKIRRSAAGETVSLDFVKMGKSVAIGTVLGIGAFFFSIYNGDTLAISSVETFVTQVGLNMAAVTVIDKLLLGRADKSKGYAMNDNDHEDSDDAEDLPPEREYIDRE